MECLDQGITFFGSRDNEKKDQGILKYRELTTLESELALLMTENHSLAIFFMLGPMDRECMVQAQRFSA